MVNGSLAAHFPEECGVEIIAEPGRFYVASAFTLTTLVHSIREIKGNETGDNKYMYYINDGVYGSFNCVIYDHAVVHPELLKVTVSSSFFRSLIFGSLRLDFFLSQFNHQEL